MWPWQQLDNSFFEWIFSSVSIFISKYILFSTCEGVYWEIDAARVYVPSAASSFNTADFNQS